MTAINTSKPCLTLGKTIAALEAGIDREQRTIRTLELRIAALQKTSPENQALIAQLKGDAAKLEKQLDSDDADLQTFKDEFAQVCGPGMH